MIKSDTYRRHETSLVFELFYWLVAFHSLTPGIWVVLLTTCSSILSHLVFKWFYWLLVLLFSHTWCSNDFTDYLSFYSLTPGVQVILLNACPSILSHLVFEWFYWLLCPSILVNSQVCYPQISGGLSKMSNTILPIMPEYLVSILCVVWPRYSASHIPVFHDTHHKSDRSRCEFLLLALYVSNIWRSTHI